MLSRSILTLAIGAAILSIGSCRKKEDTIAKIYVLDQNNSRVAGATVELIGEETGGPGHGSIRDPKVATTMSKVRPHSITTISISWGSVASPYLK